MKVHRSELLLKTSSSTGNISALTCDADGDSSECNMDPNDGSLLSVLAYSNNTSLLEEDPPRTGARRLSLERFLAEGQVKDTREGAPSLPRVPKRTVSAKARQSLGMMMVNKTTTEENKNEDSNNNKKKKQRKGSSSCPPQMPMRKDSFIQ